MKSSKTQFLISAAVAGMLAAGANATLSESAFAKDKKAAKGADKGEKVECHGINECKGKSDCHTADSACKGENSCKGKGYLKVSKAECEKKGGKVGGDHKEGKGDAEHKG
jgi:uncharacterized membrane protein